MKSISNDNQKIVTNGEEEKGKEKTSGIIFRPSSAPVGDRKTSKPTSFPTFEPSLGSQTLVPTFNQSNISFPPSAKPNQFGVAANELLTTRNVEISGGVLGTALFGILAYCGFKRFKKSRTANIANNNESVRQVDEEGSELLQINRFTIGDESEHDYNADNAPNDKDSPNPTVSARGGKALRQLNETCQIS